MVISIAANTRDGARTNRITNLPGKVAGRTTIISSLVLGTRPIELGFALMTFAGNKPTKSLVRSDAAALLYFTKMFIVSPTSMSVVTMDMVTSSSGAKSDPP
jgi:hypothetical protein